MENPSWAELRNFIHFLNTQLQDFEKSVYCSAILKQDLPGFPVFVLRFLIQMSKVIFLSLCIECLNAKYRIVFNTHFDKLCLDSFTIDKNGSFISFVYFVKDFSTRSLDISEGRSNIDIRIAAENDDESSVSMEDEPHNPETDKDIKQFQMRRKWETRFK